MILVINAIVMKVTLGYIVKQVSFEACYYSKNDVLSLSINFF